MGPRIPIIILELSSWNHNHSWPIQIYSPTCSYNLLLGMLLPRWPTYWWLKPKLLDRCLSPSSLKSATISKCAQPSWWSPRSKWKSMRTLPICKQGERYGHPSKIHGPSGPNDPNDCQQCSRAIEVIPINERIHQLWTTICEGGCPTKEFEGFVSFSFF